MTGRILIADGMATNRLVLKAKLGAAFYDVTTAAEAGSCLALLQAGPPDLLVLDWDLPEPCGRSVLEQLRASPATRDLPVIVTMAGCDIVERLRALGCGADEILQKPLDDRLLLARIRSLLRAQGGSDDLRAREATLGVIGMAEGQEYFAGSSTIAVLGTDPETARARCLQLSGQMSDHIVVLGADEALGEAPIAGRRLPDLYLIETDVQHPNAGFRLLSDLQSRQSSRHAALFMVLPSMSAELAEMGFDLGAQDVVPSAVHPVEMAIRIGNLLRRKKREDSVRASVRHGLRLAITDPLTGLFNRRYGLAQLDRLLDRAAQDGTALGVMVIDLDRFKAVNDAFGHAAGDAVLVEVARRLALGLRKSDVLARIGGEEFLVVLPDTEIGQAKLMAARLCKTIQAAPIRVNDAVQVDVTASIGLTVNAEGSPPERERMSVLVDRADRALMIAKSSGRNQVTIGRSAA